MSKEFQLQQKLETGSTVVSRILALIWAIVQRAVAQLSWPIISSLPNTLLTRLHSVENIEAELSGGDDG